MESAYFNDTKSIVNYVSLAFPKTEAALRLIALMAKIDDHHWDFSALAYGDLQIQPAQMSG